MSSNEQQIQKIHFALDEFEYMFPQEMILSVQDHCFDVLIFSVFIEERSSTPWMEKEAMPAQ